MREDLLMYHPKEHLRALSRRQFLQLGIGAVTVTGAARVAGVAAGPTLPPDSGLATHGASDSSSGSRAEGMKDSEASPNRVKQILRRYGSELGKVDNVRIRG